VGSGMSVVDSIAGLQFYDLDGTSGGTFDAVPLTTPSIPSGFVVVNSVSVLNYQAGDYDFNGTVNSADYTVWRNNFGSTTNASADGNGDGVVNTRDYVVWRNTLGQSGGPGSGAAELGSAVPEPSAAFLAFWGTIPFFAKRRRRVGA